MPSFQSTPPRGGRPPIGLVEHHRQKFQSTPPRGGRLIMTGHGKQTLRVSIHAPTRGATPHFEQRRTASLVSIHAPTRGATIMYAFTSFFCPFQSTPPRGGRPDYLLVFRRKGGFNPRPHAGGDKRKHLGRKLQRVSIHAPTRGATRTGKRGWAMNTVSIHAPTRGATICCLRYHHQLLFQSTPPRGGRRMHPNQANRQI